VQLRSSESKMTSPDQSINATLLDSAFLLLTEEHLIQQRALSLNSLFKGTGKFSYPT
jgi:hypothetical protein